MISQNKTQTGKKDSEEQLRKSKGSIIAQGNDVEETMVQKVLCNNILSLNILNYIPKELSRMDFTIILPTQKVYDYYYF